MSCNLLEPYWGPCAWSCCAVLFTQFTSAGLNRTEISLLQVWQGACGALFSLLFGKELSFVSIFQLENHLAIKIFLTGFSVTSHFNAVCISNAWNLSGSDL